MTDSLTRRDLLKAAVGLAVTAGVTHGVSTEAEAAEPAEDGNPPWYRRLLVGIEVGPTGGNDKDSIYMSKMTGRMVIENILRANAQYLVIFMKDMAFAYYDSKVARKCPQLGGRDLLRECVDEAAPHGIPVVAYCQCQYDSSSWRAHPEWRMKDSAGNELPDRLCYNSGYIEFVKALAAEMMEYPIAGFHFDMLDYGFGPPYGCWCDHCRAAFRERYGMDPPPGITWDDAWDKMLEFRCDSNSRFSQELQAFVHEHRPDISVDFNYHGYPPFNWFPGERPVQHALNGDFVTAEGLPWIFGHNNVSLLPLFMAGARPRGPVQAVSSRGVWDYHDFTVRPAAEMKWEVLTYLAHGAQFTMVDKAYYDGALEPLAYERLGEVFSEARRKQEYFGHKPVPEVGLYYSSRSRDWFGREDPPQYMRGFWGAHVALVQSHIPLGMLMDESVSLERLHDYPVVYVPHAPVLSDREVGLLTRYVEGGGRLLLTGLTGLCDPYGNIAQHSTIEQLIGAWLVRCVTDHPDNYLRLRGSDAGFLTNGVPTDWPILVHGPLAVYEPTTATGHGELLTAYRSQDNQWAWHMSPEKVVGPALLVNRVGRGTVVTVPCAIDAAAVGDYRMPEHRNLIRNILRHLNPEPPVLVDAPANIEVVVTRDIARRRLLMHLLAWSGSMTFAGVAFPNGKRVLPPQMEEPLPYEATITVNVGYESARALGPTTTLHVHGSAITLDTRETHEVLVLGL